MTGRRRPLFIAGALLLPVLALGVVELGLRVVGFGGDHPLFVEYEDWPGRLRANPELMRRYVQTRGAPAAAIDPFPFAAEKPPGSFRIVVQGGSSAAGFPFGRWGGLAGMLADRLEATFPDGRVEVISTALAAVNSHTLLDLVDEIIATRPDAVLVYAGHNEYVGVLGVGSALTVGNAAAALHLRARRLRLYQLAGWLAALVRDVGAAAGGGDRDTLFARAATGSAIAFGSERYRAGLRQFEQNMDRLLARYREAGVPVYLATVAGNEKDLPPFAGGPGPGVDRGEWERLAAATRAALDAGDAVSAEASARALIALDERAADAWFALGRALLAARDFTGARAAFRAARDRDAIRFRAPGELNGIARALADRHGATLVDVEARFAAASPGGIVGRELLLEHVHPNADGYFLLADAFYEALRADGRIGDWSGAPDREQARRDMPLTEIDRIVAALDTLELEAGYPFSDPPRAFRAPPPRGEVERLAHRLRADEIEWIEAMEQLAQIRQRQGRMRDAARIARLAAHEYPTDRAPNLAAGLLLLETGRPARARLYLDRSLRAAPDDPATLAALVRAHAALGDVGAEERDRARLRQVAPGRAVPVAPTPVPLPRDGPPGAPPTAP